MRTLGAVLLVPLIVLPVAAQSDSAVAQNGVAGRPAAQVTKFPKSAIRGATSARVPARSSQSAAQTSARPRSGEAATAAATARKRAPGPPGPSRDTSMPVSNRLAIQLDLAWTGDYNGLINGEFDDKTTAAIKAFQRNRKFKETGVLNAQERALLAASAKAKQAQVGWAMLDDAVTGARLGVPTKQVPNKGPGKSGARWSSAQGQVQVETFRIREPGTTLASVYDQQKKEPSTRKLAMNLLRPDFFILSGMQGLKKFYVRAEFKDSEVRGMTLLYDQATENIMDPVAVVMTSAFTGFPSVTGVAQIGPPPKRKVEYGTGIVVSAAGHILTDRQLTEGCNVMVVSGYGDADRQTEDRIAELALLRIYGVPDLVPAAFTGDALKGPDLIVVGISDPQSQGGGGAISTLAARLKGDGVEPAPQPGFSGAAVLDGEGRLGGMMKLKMPVIAAAGAANSQTQATVVSAQSIRAFLEAQKLPPATGRPGLDGAKAAIVRVICVRK